MPLTLHHLTKSQSERIVFLLEELQLPYTLTVHARNPKTALSPDSLKAIHPSGTAPVLIDEAPNPNGTDERVILAESGACVEYILSTYAPESRLVKHPGDAAYADYLAWLHNANGTLQPTMSRLMMLRKAGVAEDTMTFQFLQAKLSTSLKLIEAQLKKTGAYLVGDELTAADVMTLFTLTTMRGFSPLDLTGYPEILKYFGRVSERPAYKRTMEKGDKGLTPLLAPKVEPFKFG